MEDVVLVGVADPDLEVREQAAVRYHTRGFADHCALLEAEKPDIALVAVPTQEHYRIASDLIERGIHLLVEKPIALTVEEGCALVEQARARGVKLGVGHVERFNPAIMALKQRLGRGELGQLFQISVRRVGGFPPRVKDVGVVLDLATHDLDVMRHLAGTEVTRVSAEIAHRLKRPQEDLVCGLLRFANGVIGLLNVNWLSPTKIRELMVHGEQGMFMVNYLTQDLYLYENNYRDNDWESLQVFRGMGEGRMIRYPIARREPLQVELEFFIRSVLHDEPFPVSGEDGLQALALAQHLLSAGQQGKSVHIDAHGCGAGPGAR
jgi:UDP-N-acetylglucosamine 3-dehydrogenase